MGNLTLNGATSGQITLAPPSVAGTNTLTLPAATTTLVGQSTTDTLTNKTLTSPTISGTPVMGASIITSGTVQNTTSGTAILFTGIPSWAKRITVMLNGVSTNGTNNILLQVGSGSLTTSGYNSIGGGSINGLAPAVNNSSTGFLLYNDTATDVRNGNIVINLISNYVYICSYVLGGASTRNVIWWGAGSISLGGALDRVSLITTSTDTFDAGSINIMYE